MWDMGLRGTFSSAATLNLSLALSRSTGKVLLWNPSLDIFLRRAFGRAMR
jgi:hypothetical protein